MTVVSSHLEEFLHFLSEDVKPAYEELKELPDASRKHLQKLVYTNLVDRFDYMIDKTFLDRVIQDSDFRDEVCKKSKEEFINLGDLVGFFLNEDKSPKEIAIERLQDQLRQGTLKERHSKKLRKLFLLFGTSDSDISKPRVNSANGKILVKMKKHKSIPNSIAGYADWLYSRRNAIVHGGGTAKISSNDFRYMKKVFYVKPAQYARLSLSSVKNAINFYECAVEFLFKK